MRSAAVFLVALLIATTADAAKLVVQLPEDAALQVVEGTPPAEGTRIQCPPTCTYAQPGKSVGIIDLKVEPVLDPRTGDRPWDIVAINGCRGTSVLPADNAKCFLPTEGDVTISFEVRYRPILAATFGGTYGQPLALFLTGAAGPNYQGSGSSFSCNITLPDVGELRCAAHLSAGQPVQIDAPSGERAVLQARSGPCADQPSRLCSFILEHDTCVAHQYANASSTAPTFPLNGPACPTGPGTGGGGGGGGGGGPPPELKDIKDRARVKLRSAFEQALGPCGTILLYLPTGPVGLAVAAIAGPTCSTVVQRIAQLLKIVHDPPDLDFDTIAPVTPSARPSLDLPSCAGLSKEERRVCRRATKLVRRYVGKVTHVTDVATALRITVERASGAIDAGEDGALRRQLRAAGKRERQLAAALAASARLGGQIAALLTDQGVTAVATEAQFTQGAEVVLGKVVEAGVADAEIREALGPALTPTTLDLLAVLGQP